MSYSEILMCNIYLTNTSTSSTYKQDHIKAIQWGREHEQEGIKALEVAKNVKINATGLWLHKCGFIGASPDGLINDDFIVEVKCPYKYRQLFMLDDIKEHKNYILISDKDGNISVNNKHEYYSQVQGQLEITGRVKCYLGEWTPQETIIMDIQKEDFSEEISCIKSFF